MTMSKHKCIVPNCNISSTNNPGMRFFCFPVKPHLLETWRRNLSLTSFLEKKSAEAVLKYRVCALHFSDTCFQTHEKLKLNRGAIPLEHLKLEIQENSSQSNDSTVSDNKNTSNGQTEAEDFTLPLPTVIPDFSEQLFKYSCMSEYSSQSDKKIMAYTQTPRAVPKTSPQNPIKCVVEYNPSPSRSISGTLPKILKGIEKKHVNYGNTRNILMNQNAKLEKIVEVLPDIKHKIIVISRKRKK